MTKSVVLLTALSTSAFANTAYIQQSPLYAANQTSYSSYESDSRYYQREEKNKLSFGIGGLLGAGLLNQDRGLSLNYGGRIGFSMDSYVTMGVYYSRMSLFSNDVSSAYLNLLMGETNLFFEGDQEGLYLGAKAGVSIIESKSLGVSSTDTDLALGPALGFEYPFAEIGRSKLNFGTEANYTFVTTSADPDAFGILGTIRLVFQ